MNNSEGGERWISVVAHRTAHKTFPFPMVTVPPIRVDSLELAKSFPGKVSTPLVHGHFHPHKSIPILLLLPLRSLQNSIHSLRLVLLVVGIIRRGNELTRLIGAKLDSSLTNFVNEVR